jgi:hypothetical protein
MEMNAEQLEYYRNEFAEWVNGFARNVRAGTPPYNDRTARAQAIEQRIDEYVCATGERPDSGELERLSNAILYEELSDKRRNKMSIEEYPFMSDQQLERRKYGSHTRKHSSRKHEVPLSVAAFVGIDGVDYRDARIAVGERKATNNERKKQYREFTKEQPVSTYTVEEESK